MGGMVSQFIFTCAKEHMEGKDTSINGAMTLVHPRHERWAAASVLVLSGRQWATAYRLVSLIRGCLIGGES